MKIFIGLLEIAGYMKNLKKGFDELGLESVFVDLHEHPFKYSEPSNRLVLQYRYFSQKRYSIPRYYIFQKVWWIGLLNITKIILFIWAILRFDVFIFGFGTSFFSLYDFPVLRLLGKKIICVYFGSDARPTFMNGAAWIETGEMGVEEIIKQARKQKSHIKKTEKYAHVMVNHVGCAHFHERAFVPWFCIGIPIALNIPSFKTFKPKEGKIRILHAPSRPEAKGTPRIRQAIAHLQSRGYSIEFIEITDKPNSFVLQELATCDFVFDQLYSDTPMATFATEAAFFGKPAIVGGYAQELIRQTTPDDMIPPSLFCHPEALEEAIEKMITDQEYRRTLGEHAMQFVKNCWKPKKVAERYLRLMEGNIPNEWLFNPKNIQYLHGGGFSEQRAKRLIRSIIEKYGKEVLQLSDKPELERRFVEFAYAENTNV